MHNLRTLIGLSIFTISLASQANIQSSTGSVEHSAVPIACAYQDRGQFQQQGKDWNRQQAKSYNEQAAKIAKERHKNWDLLSSEEKEASVYLEYLCAQRASLHNATAGIITLSARQGNTTALEKVSGTGSVGSVNNSVSGQICTKKAGGTSYDKIIIEYGSNKEGSLDLKSLRSVNVVENSSSIKMTNIAITDLSKVPRVEKTYALYADSVIYFDDGNDSFSARLFLSNDEGEINGVLDFNGDGGLAKAFYSCTDYPKSK